MGQQVAACVLGKKIKWYVMGRTDVSGSDSFLLIRFDWLTQEDDVSNQARSTDSEQLSSWLGDQRKTYKLFLNEELPVKRMVVLTAERDDR